MPVVEQSRIRTSFHGFVVKFGQSTPIVVALGWSVVNLESAAGWAAGQQVHIAGADTARKRHAGGQQAYPKRVINCWILVFSSGAGLYFSDSLSCSSAFILSPFCEYAIPRWKR